MAVEQRCECCDLLVAFCGKAAERDRRARDRREREEVLTRPGWFAAQHRGMCHGCGEWFPPGTPITRHPVGWRALCCAEDIGVIPEGAQECVR